MELIYSRDAADGHFNLSMEDGRIFFFFVALTHSEEARV
jgi:hypothetical protein